MSDDRQDELDDALRAVAHQTRRAILRLTAGEAVPAMSLAEALEIAPATASEHLRVLRKTRLVDLTSLGTQRLYRANPTRVRALIAELSRDLQTDE